MKVWGFIGSSGTGKSHRALSIAKVNGIDAIIDDGLLIKENSILAGTSAKREASKLASVRRALFYDAAHAQSVKAAIDDSGVDSILILGTSEHMVDSIAAKIGLPPISYYIHISDVASTQEIDTALSIRKKQGKHIIPAPTFAVKKHFSGYFIDPLRRFSKIGRGKKLVEEKTVVRPTFSYMGNYTITMAAIEQAITIIAYKSISISSILDIKVEMLDDGLTIALQLAVKYGRPINIVLEELQRDIREEVESQTALNVHCINLTAKSLVI